MFFCVFIPVRGIVIKTMPSRLQLEKSFSTLRIMPVLLLRVREKTPFLCLNSCGTKVVSDRKNPSRESEWGVEGETADCCSEKSRSRECVRDLIIVLPDLKERRKVSKADLPFFINCHFAFFTSSFTSESVKSDKEKEQALW